MIKNKHLNILLVILILAAGCSSDVKTYKADYRGNFPEGSFKINLGKNNVLTNGKDILEIRVKKEPDFFCYAVNNRSLCRFDISVKITGAAAENLKVISQSLKEAALKSGKPRTTLPERLSYFLNGQKLEVEDIILINGIKDEINSTISIPILGKGNNGREAREDALKNSKELISVLADKPNI